MKLDDTQSMAQPHGHAEPLNSTEVVALADVLLIAMRERHATALLLEPQPDGYTITLELSALREQARCAATIGHGLACRLALLGGIDLTQPEAGLGRLRLRHAGDSSDVQFLAVTRQTPLGLGLELRRVLTDAPGDQTTPQALTPALELEQLGPYSLREKLGEGGLGLVFKATHIGLGKTVAIKVLNDAAAADPNTAARFVREARAAAAVRHPGVVDVTDFGTLPSGRAWLVMEWIDAPTLNQVMKQRGTLPPKEAVPVFRAMLVALQAVHARGLVHRDLKPSNLFVLGPGKVKICDFGAARLVLPAPGTELDSITQTGMVVGTPGYLSPEQARGADCDHRSDLYGAGCVMFQVLSGRLPFRAPTFVEMLASHLNEPVPSLTAVAPQVPPALARIVERCLAKDPAARFQSAAELEGALAAVEKTL